MAGIGRKKKKKFDYYDAFEAQAALCVKEAKLLKEIVHDFESAAELEKELSRAHAIEREPMAYVIACSKRCFPIS